MSLRTGAGHFLTTLRSGARKRFRPVVKTGTVAATPRPVVQVDSVTATVAAGEAITINMGSSFQYSSSIGAPITNITAVGSAGAPTLTNNATFGYLVKEGTAGAAGVSGTTYTYTLTATSSNGQTSLPVTASVFVDRNLPSQRFPLGDGTTTDIALTITNELAALASGSTYNLATVHGAGIYPVNLRVNPQNSQYKVAIRIPNNITFDFSECEIQLIANQAVVTTGNVAGGTPDARYADIINNTGLNNGCSGITINVGCLNGQAAFQKTATGADFRCNGIKLWKPTNCTVQGSASGTRPYAGSATESGLTVNYGGVIKNVRGYSGGGGAVEAFMTDFYNTGTGDICRRVHFLVDDGAERSATGGSTESGNSGALFEDIVCTNVRAQGMTSWKAETCTRNRVIARDGGASGVRNEYGSGHRDTSVVSVRNANNGVNQKATTDYQSDVNCRFLDNTNYPMEINGVTNPVFRGQARTLRPPTYLKVTNNLVAPDPTTSTGVQDLTTHL